MATFEVAHEQGKKTVSKQSTVCIASTASQRSPNKGNTSNMSAHLRLHHPAVTLSGAARRVSLPPKTQPSIAAAFRQQYSYNSQRHNEYDGVLGPRIYTL